MLFAKSSVVCIAREEKRECEDFVDRLKQDNEYKLYMMEKRKVRDWDHFCRQALYSKEAEFGVRKFLLERPEVFGSLPESVRPDTTVKTKRTRDWEADLNYRKIDPKLPSVHVKSCLTEDLRDESPSWIFNYSNSDGIGGRDKIFDQGDDLDWCVFVEVTKASGDMLIHGVADWRTLSKQGLLAYPRKESLRYMKRAVYSKDLRGVLSA
jgi:hypothetical protein